MNSYLEKLIWINEKGTDYENIDSEEEVIQVNEFVGKMSSIYEKMRNAFDFKDEHILRKNSIRRIIKRLFLLNKDPNKISKHLLSELVRAGYFTSKQIPKSKINRIAKIINKYQLILKKISFGNVAISPSVKWLMEIAACELDEEILSPAKDEALASLMYNQLRNRVNITGKKNPSSDLSIILYVAILRAIRKSDQAMIEYSLLKYYSPGWKEFGEESIDSIISKLAESKNFLEKKAKSSAIDKLYRKVKREVMPYLMLREVIENEPAEAESIITDKVRLSERIKQICEKRYSRLRKVLNRSAFRAIIYVLLTKTILALILELPYEMYILQEINYLPLSINIIFHPLLLLLLVVSVKQPTEKDTNKIVEKIFKITGIIVAQESIIKINLSKKSFKTRIYYGIFTIITLLIFSLIIWGLLEMGFNTVSIFLFLVFLCVVTFLGVRVRGSAREYKVSYRKEGALTQLADFISLPIIRVGKWITINFTRVNLIVVIIDLAIEAPFKIIMQYVDEWFSFLKEIKDEIID